MDNQNPATPGQATAPVAEPAQATPGNSQQGSSQTPAPATQQGQQGNNPAQSVPPGMVIIPTEEYGNLQRNSARLQSIQKRGGLRKSSTTPSNDDSNPSSDPLIAEELGKERSAREAAEARAFALEVKTSVRDILEKPEYKDLPASTKRLILKNPASISNADNLEEALLDVEDFVREEVAAIQTATPSNPAQPVQQPTQTQGAPAPAGHEAPPQVTAAAPANPSTAGSEDVSNLQGSARSRAALRNSIRKSKSGS